MYRFGILFRAWREDLFSFICSSMEGRDGAEVEIFKRQPSCYNTSLERAKNLRLLDTKKETPQQIIFQHLFKMAVGQSFEMINLKG